MIRVVFRAADERTPSEWENGNFYICDGLVWIREDYREGVGAKEGQGALLAAYPLELVAAVERVDEEAGKEE